MHICLQTEPYTGTWCSCEVEQTEQSLRRTKAAPGVTPFNGVFRVMIRVLICTPSYTRQGGAERILESVYHGLDGRGFEIIFGLAQGTRFHDPEAYGKAFPGIRSVHLDGTRGTRLGRC